MTLTEKAIEMFGLDYIKECPAQLFKISCFADNSFPTCRTKGCWNYHRTDIIEYKENNKEIFQQQLKIDSM